MAVSVQFTDIESLLEAYIDQDIPVFAVFHGRQLICKYVGDDLDAGAGALKKCCDRWKTAGSVDTYMLCLYDGEFEKISSKTAYDMAWNFRLNERGAVGAAMGYANYNASDITSLAVENALLKEKLARIEDEMDSDNDAEKVDPIMGAIDKLMGIPGMDALIGAIANKGADLISSIGKKDNVVILDPSEAGAGPATVRRVSGVPGVSPGLDRCMSAVQDLMGVMNDTPDLLEKLVRLSRKEPIKFKLCVAGLRSMKV